MLRYHRNNRNMYQQHRNNNHLLSSISRTARYKKFTKPLLERKRRARMNRCVDELKLLFGSLEAEGENVNKLEKADVLEMTVKYIKRISRRIDPIQEARRFQAGFSECASEACKFLCLLPGSNSAVSNRLVEHLKQCIAKPSGSFEINFPTHPHNLQSTLQGKPNGADRTSPSPWPSPSPSPPSTTSSSTHRHPTSPANQQSRSLCKPPFKLSFRFDEKYTLNARTSRSASENGQRNDFMWRPW